MNQRRRNSSDELTPEDLFRPEPMDGGSTGGTIAGEVLYSSQDSLPWNGAGQQQPQLPQSSDMPEYFGDATAVAPIPDYAAPTYGVPNHGVQNYGSPGGGEASTQFLPPFPADGGPGAAPSVREWQPQQQSPQQPTYGGGYQNHQQSGYPQEYQEYQGYQAQPQFAPQQPYTPVPPASAPKTATPPPRGRGGLSGGFSGGRPSNRMIAAIAIVACAVLGIGGAVAGAGSGGTSNAPTAAPKTSTSASAPAGSGGGSDNKVEAQALSALLGTAANGRAAVISAVGNVKNCQNLGQAQQDLTTAAALRKQLIQQLDVLQTGGLTGGHDLVDDLRKGWQESAEADSHYAAWAAQSKSSCAQSHHPKSGGELSDGDAASGRASAAKGKASKLWNAIAAETGLPTRSSTQL